MTNILLVGVCVAVAVAVFSALLGIVAVSIAAVDVLAVEREARRRGLRERLAADIILAIEEAVAAQQPRIRITARDKAMRFFELARREPELRALGDEQLLQLLRSTLPKIALGAFADPRGGLRPIET